MQGADGRPLASFTSVAQLPKQYELAAEALGQGMCVEMTGFEGLIVSVAACDFGKWKF